MPSKPSTSTLEAAAAHHARTHARLSMAGKIAAILALTLIIYFIPAPEGIDPRGMHMAGIFAGTILGLILQPLPTASVALVGLAAAMVTGTMDAKTEALQGFGNSTIWLIVAAFFIADGFLLTGLGRRIALLFVSWLGRSSLGLSYGMALADLVLSPATPSNTARAGGVVYPIVRSLASVNDSHPSSAESRKRLGSYLSLTSVQVNTITSACSSRLWPATRWPWASPPMPVSTSPGAPGRWPRSCPDSSHSSLCHGSWPRSTSRA